MHKLKKIRTVHYGRNDDFISKLLTVLKVSNPCIFELQSFKHMRDV